LLPRKGGQEVVSVPYVSRGVELVWDVASRDERVEHQEQVRGKKRRRKDIRSQSACQQKASRR
jgi:hypothetical protein